MSTAADHSVILSHPQDHSLPVVPADDGDGLSVDLRVRFAMICGIALGLFMLLISLDDFVAQAHFRASGDQMVIEKAHGAAVTAVMAARSADDLGPASRRELSTAASELLAASASGLTMRSGPMAMRDGAATHALSQDLSHWASGMEALALANNANAETAARSALRDLGATDLVSRLSGLAEQTLQRARILGHTELALRIAGLVIACIVFMAIWIFVIKPQSRRQQAVLKRLRRNEYAARELAAKAAQADEAKANFLSVISHELRTPMNGILGCAELIRVGAHDQRAQKLATTICESGADLMAIVTDILDFTDMKSGEFELFDGVVDAEQLVDDIKAKFADQAKAAQARLEVSLLGDQDRTRRGDMARITQILSNLTDNAIRFTPRGAVFVTIDNRFPRTLSLTVRDTGVGMSPPEVARAFAPFSQADAGATRRRGGAGMGLTIVKKLVDAMDGDVRLQSRAGAGTTVTVAVPLPFSETQAMPDCSRKPPPEKKPRRLKLNAA